MKNKYGGASPKLKRRWVKQDIHKIFTGKELKTYRHKDPNPRTRGDALKSLVSKLSDKKFHKN